MSGPIKNTPQTIAQGYLSSYDSKKPLSPFKVLKEWQECVDSLSSNKAIGPVKFVPVAQEEYIELKAIKENYDSVFGTLREQAIDFKSFVKYDSSEYTTGLANGLLTALSCFPNIVVELFPDPREEKNKTLVEKTELQDSVDIKTLAKH